MKINLLIGAALAALFVWNPYPFQILELKSLDALIMSRGEVQDEAILLVDIDEEIVKAYGGYPLPRNFYADAVKKTEGVPGITVAFPDADIHGYDAPFQQELFKSPTVLSFIGSTQTFEQGPHVGTAQLGNGNPSEWLYNYPGILRQVQVLAESADGVGVINSAPELDGVVRRVPLVVTSQNKLYPSFALEMLRVAVDDPSYQINTQSTGVEWLRIPSYPPIKTDANGRIWITSNVKFYRQSAADFLREPMEGAVWVIFGVTALVLIAELPLGSLYQLIKP